MAATATTCSPIEEDWQGVGFVKCAHAALLGGPPRRTSPWQRTKGGFLHCQDEAAGKTELAGPRSSNLMNPLDKFLNGNLLGRAWRPHSSSNRRKQRGAPAGTERAPSPAEGTFPLPGTKGPCPAWKRPAAPRSSHPTPPLDKSPNGNGNQLGRAALHHRPSGNCCKQRGAPAGTDRAAVWSA